jgi:hypothetical protein
MAMGLELLCRGDRCVGGGIEPGETASDPLELRLSGVFSRTGVLRPDRTKGSGWSSTASEVFEYVLRRGVCRGRKERGDKGVGFLSDRPRLDIVCMKDESVFNFLLRQLRPSQPWSHRSVGSSSRITSLPTPRWMMMEGQG